MRDASKLLEKAKKSTFYLWLLNLLLRRLVPFNRPHFFRVMEISDHHVRVVLPYRKSNLNHIKGLHACALATLTEFSSGLLLLSRLGMRKYRLILERLEMDYHFQGKSDATVEFEIRDEWLETNIIQPLHTKDMVSVNCLIKTYDHVGNLLSSGTAYWQIKDWSKVKTKVV